ncbi:hypothetical protein HYU92_05415 [Candidatus Curtissbacteria bacterium]|nr:hypothetical protein [Candidatus Curtissbacteria bacterium]
MIDQKTQILNIAVNLNRIGNWAADGFDNRKKRIETFVDQTSDYVKEVDKSKLKNSFKKTFLTFLKNWGKLKRMEKIQNELLWAEKMMTWGNILTHRAKLLKKS